MSPALARRLRAAVPSALLAVTIYVPLLLTRPGRVGADTKTYLYLDPGRLLGRAPSMWDPNIGMGTVTHQNIGYLWPIGPWYWAMDLIGMPDWVAQRLWLGTILFAAGLGTRFMLKALGQEGPHVTAATFCYALTPYVLSLAARLSVILLPYAGLPWLIGLTVLALRRGGWRYPALFGLVVATIGSVNATALILAGVAPVLWIAHEVLITREARLADAARTVARIGVMTVGCSLWWMAGLWAQSGYGIEILRFTETAETVATASLSLEVLRGLGYWFFYGEDRFGPWIAPSRSYTQRVELLVLTYAIPVLGLVGAAVARFRERAFFLLLLAVGLALAVGGHPWDDPAPGAAAIKAFLQSEVGLSMRSLPRAAPLVMLSLSVFVGALVAAATRDRPRLARPLTAMVVVLAVAGLPPLWRGQMVDENLDRPEEIPSYWLEAAAFLDERDDGTRVLEVPGADFASYRWGTTVDPVTPGLMDRPYVARELIPYGSAPSADVLNALDRRMQEQVLEPQAVAPMARFMAVGDIVVRSDLTYERYNTPRPRRLWDLLTSAPGLGEPIGFGGTERNVARPELPLLDEQELLTPHDLPDPPRVGVLPVDDALATVRTAPAGRPILLSGDGEGLVDLATAGLVTGDELIVYSGWLAGDPDGLQQALDRGATLVVTDTNRRQARRWGTVRDTTGITERPGQEQLRADPKDQRLDLFPDADDDAFTVTESRGGVFADATSYGNSVSLTPEDDPANAVDGSGGTAWRIGGFSSATGESIRLTYRVPITTDRMWLLQAIGGVRNRFITEVEIEFDEDGEPMTVELDDRSRTEDTTSDGQEVRFDRRTFETVTITVTETDPGGLRRYDGISSVGFAEIKVVDEGGTQPLADDVVRLPIDLLDAVGDEAGDHPLAVVLTRQRVAGTVAVRSDPEPSMDRTFSLPGGRTFGVVGQVRLSHAAPDHVVDAALGLADASEDGVTARSKRRLPGGLENRAMAAIDGDPDTWYSPGFLDQRNEYVDYELPEPITFGDFELTVLNDGRHTVPQVVRLEVDGTPVQRIELPPIADRPEVPDARHTFEVTLDREVTGARITLVVEDEPDAVRDVETLDWFTDDPLVMPIGIVELAIDGLDAPPLPERVDDRCRDDLIEVDGEPVEVRLVGSTDQLLRGEPIDLELCATDLELPAGQTTLRTAPGGTSGFDIDRLVMQSAAGGGAGAPTALLSAPATAPPPPAIEVVGAGRTSLDLVVPRADDEFWLVLNQSHNPGWRATAGGADLGPPMLVNGYANAWLVPAGTGIELRVEWTPQRIVRIMVATSLGFVLAALALVAWPRRRRGEPPTDDRDLAWSSLDGRATMPLALDLGRITTYDGPSPSLFASVATTAAAGAAGFAMADVVGLAAVALAALVALRFRRARPILTVVGPALVVASVAVQALRQLVQDLPAGFDWPTYFGALHHPVWIGVLLVVLDPVVERCWLRRWWPNSDRST